MSEKAVGELREAAWQVERYLGCKLAGEDVSEFDPYRLYRNLFAARREVDTDLDSLLLLEARKAVTDHPKLRAQVLSITADILKPNANSA